MQEAVLGFTGNLLLEILARPYAFTAISLGFIE